MTGYAGIRDYVGNLGMGISVGFFLETTGSLRNPETRRTPSYAWKSEQNQFKHLETYFKKDNSASVYIKVRHFFLKITFWGASNSPRLSKLFLFIYLYILLLISETYISRIFWLQSLGSPVVKLTNIFLKFIFFLLWCTYNRHALSRSPAAVSSWKFCAVTRPAAVQSAAEPGLRSRAPSSQRRAQTIRK